MMKYVLPFSLLYLLLVNSHAQVAEDTIPSTLNMDAVYNRPFLTLEKAPVALGGYIEANSSYFGTDGLTDGLSFQIPRMTIFMAASLRNRIRFLSEIEFEEGGKEIAIEFAAMDLSFHPLLNLRGGIVMNPIGAFNQNHDGPRWEFIDRPIASTTIIPATWSNVGFGLYGKYAIRKWVMAYEAYLTNGFDDQIIDNTQNRTWLPASKENSKRFEESFNGEPLTTLKVAFKHLSVGEIGFSWMGGVYNKFEEDGLTLDERRRLDVLAIDFNTRISWTKTTLTGEYVRAYIEVPDTYSPNFGSRQQGAFLDIVQPVWQKSVFGWEQAAFFLAVRLEYADYNIGEFEETGENIYDHIYALSPAISFRPAPETVLRFNYRRLWERDLVGNPAVPTVGYQLGFSTYF